MSTHARDLDEGTVTDDNPGNPTYKPTIHSRGFTPFDNKLFFKFTNSTDEILTLQQVRVRLEDPGEGIASGQGTLSSQCSGYVVNPTSPLRTTVTERVLDYQSAQIALGIQLQPCESILIEANGAQIGVEHVVTLLLDTTTYPVMDGTGFLEIWDGACND